MKKLKFPNVDFIKVWIKYRKRRFVNEIRINSLICLYGPFCQRKMNFMSLKLVCLHDAAFHWVNFKMSALYFITQEENHWVNYQMDF